MMTRRDNLDLEREIFEIQKSTRTLFRVFTPMHNWLRVKSKMYYMWAKIPYCRVVHWSALFTYICLITAISANFILPKNTKAIGEAQGFPRWEWVNPSPSGNQLNNMTECGGDLWAVGDRGTIVQYYAATNGWKNHYTGVESNLSKIACLNDNKILVGVNNGVLEYNGITWSQKTLTGFSGTVSQIIKISDQSAVLIGAGKIIRYSNDTLSFDESSNFGSNYSDIVQTSNGNLIASGSGIIATYNGSTWHKETSVPVNLNFAQLKSFSNGTVLAFQGSATTALAMKSVDNGNSWTTLTAVNGLMPDIGIAEVIDDNGIIAISDFIGIDMRSTDFGESWSQATGLATQDLPSYVKISAQSAVACDTTSCYYSSDQGAGWSGLESDAFLYGSRKSFQIENTTYIIRNTAEIWRSNNPTTEESSWTDLSNSLNVSDINFRSMVSGTGGQILAAGGKSIFPFYYGAIVKYNGTNWSKLDIHDIPNHVADFANSNFSKAVEFENGTLLAVGQNSSSGCNEIRSINGGSTWTKRTWPDIDSTPSNCPLLESFGNIAYEAFSSGDADPRLANRTIHVTTDAGATWKNIYEDNEYIYEGPNVVSGELLSSGDLMLVGLGGAIYKIDITLPLPTYALTTEASDTTQRLNKVKHFSETNAIAVGDNGAITHFNGTSWAAKAPVTTASLKDLAFLSSGDAIAVGANRTILKYNHISEDWSVVQTGGTGDFTKIKIFIDDDGEKIVVTSDTKAMFTRSSDLGATWNLVDSGLSNTFSASYAAGYNDIIFVGNNGSIIRYYSPFTEIATKLLIKLPGQTFSDRDTDGVKGDPFTAYAGVPYKFENPNNPNDIKKVEVYAINGSNYEIAPSYAYEVGFTTTDPNDTNPPNTKLDSDLSVDTKTCNDGSQERIASPCGIGYNDEFIFKTPGKQRITARTIEGTLQQGISSEIKVLPGSPHHPRFSESSISLPAGIATKISIGLGDVYNNATSDDSKDRKIRLSTDAPYGRFSMSQAGPWSENLDIDFLKNNRENESYQSVEFWFVGFTPSSSKTITAADTSTVDTINSSSLPLTITDGVIDQPNSHIEISNTTPTAGETITATVTVSSTQQSHEISLYSSRPEDVITKISNTDKTAVFTIDSKTAGRSIISAKADNTWLQETKTINRMPGAVSIIKTPDKVSLSAGSSSSATITLYDGVLSPSHPFGNIVTTTTDTLAFSSTDPKAILPSEYTMKPSDAGTHSFDFTLKTSGPQKITVEDKNTKAKGTIDIEVLDGSISPTVSAFFTTKNKIINGKDKSTLTVKITDEFENPLGGKFVSLSFDQAYGSLNSSVAKETASDGTTTFEFTPSKEGKVEFTAFASDTKDGDKIELKEKITLEVLSDTLLNSIASLADTLQHSPIAKKIADISKSIVATTATLGLIPLIANVISGAPAAAHLITYTFSLGLEAIGLKKKRRNWGRVYDSANGKGVDMAVVRLFEQEKMKLIATVVTDPKGKFAFQPPPGRYALSVSKEGFVFPTSIFAKYGLKRITKDPSAFNGHYVGQVLEVKEGNNVINIEVPIDSIKDKASILLRIKIFSEDVIGLVNHGLPLIFIPLTIAGMLLSAFTAIVSPTQRNIIFFLVYLIITVSYITSKIVRSNRTGVVYDAVTRKPISGAAVSVFDQHYNSLRETRITDRFGRFNMLVQGGSYYLRVSREGYEFPAKFINNKNERDHKYKNLYFGKPLTFKDASFITVSMPMDPNGDKTKLTKDWE